jgi:SET domain-containing protein
MAEEVVCPGRIDGHRTPAGRFINHSIDPNTTSRKFGEDIAAVALRVIQKNEEILISYRTSMQVNIGMDMPGDLLCLDG